MALSGDGGDELFAGYDRYRLAGNASGLPGLPRALRKGGGAARSGRSTPICGRPIAGVPCPGGSTAPGQGDRIAKLARVMRTGERRRALPRRALDLGEAAATCCACPAAVPTSEVGAQPEPIGTQDFLSLMQYRDSAGYLPDDILVKLDRASMAVGLEARVPMLDHRLVEFAWRLPAQDTSSRRGRTKWLLRRVVRASRAATALMERPKMGFNVPVGDWLRGTLARLGRGPARPPARIKSEGVLDADHRGSTDLDPALWTGRHDWTNRLWTVLMFRAWAEKWR